MVVIIVTAGALAVAVVTIVAIIIAIVIVIVTIPSNTEIQKQEFRNIDDRRFGQKIKEIISGMIISGASISGAHKADIPAINITVFQVLEPSKGCTIVTRSRTTDQQSRRSNALLLCIVPGQIKKQGTHEPRDLQRFEREGETTPEFPPPPPPPPLPPPPPSLSS
uniref:Uncharacterized protein n=1 Tax=Vespula pensylvanica TaxID=30213 RepID=A0A834KHU4_VESPE|nr:hypothetical protein H0235_014687 [Vespula pensylvanica]